jgi:predicted  nucleic acid-binding Zn-ribbon protein
MATELRRVIETLTLREKEDSTLVKLAGCCCTGCRSKINVLDEMISGVVRVARLLENLTSHQIGVTDSMDQELSFNTSA